MNESQYTFSDSGSTESATPFEWRDYVTILLERIWILITVLVICVCASLVHLKRQTPLYRSSSRIAIEAAPRTLLNLQDVLYMSRNNEEIFNTHIKTLTSRTLMKYVLDSEALRGNPDLMNWDLPEESRVDVALGMLQVHPVPKSRLIDIVVFHTSPEVAALFANSVGQSYIRMDMDERMGKSLEVVEWLKKQADVYRDKLEAGLLSLQKYRVDQHSVSLEERQDVVVSKLQSLSRALTAAENETLSLRADVGLVRDVKGDPEKLLELAVIAKDPEVINLRAVLELKRNEKLLLGANYRGNHPEIIQINNEIEIAAATLKRTCLKGESKLNASYKSALMRQEELAYALENQEKEAFELDKMLVPYGQLKRDVEADKQIYEGMLARMKEAHVAGDMEINSIRMIDEARVMRGAVHPNPKKIMVSGLMMGLVFGVGACFLVHFLDSRIRRVEDAERTLKLPVLAAIPHIATQVRHHGRIIDLKPNSGPAEAFRTLRATIALQPHGKSAKVLLTTSVGPGEGKSLVSSNLASVYAQDNQKTLLIDADLRRPTVHKTFELGKGSDLLGFSDVLNGTCGWKQAVIVSETKGLDVLPSGKIPSNPAELLGSGAMTALLAELRGSYDRIILDSPPVMGVSDPLVMLPQVDGIIFVLHFGKTRKHAARLCIQQLAAANVPILGTVLDNIQMGRVGSYYHYYYHRYGGYNYHSEEEPSAPHS